MTSFVDLPDVLVDDILSRLSVKNLVQSSGVCKTWYSIIKNATFIAAHFSRSIADPSNYYIFQIYIHKPLMIVVSRNNLITRNDISYVINISKSQKIIGSVKGLICLTDAGKYYGRDIYLFNPFIHKYKKLGVGSSCYADLIAKTDTSGRPKRNKGKKEYQYRGNIQVGFGFCEVENDYKVVRIINHYQDPSSKVAPYCGKSKAEIYTLKSRTWKCVDASFEILPFGSCVSVHGCLYWCLVQGYPQLYNPTVGHLLCFDLKDEVFKVIQLPKIVFEHYTYMKPPALLVKDGSLALAFDLWNYTPLKFCLLVLENDSGGQVRWKELYYNIVNINPNIYIGFSVCGRRLIFVDWNGLVCNLVAVDLDNSCATETLKLEGSLYRCIIDPSDYLNHIVTRAVNVMESLILFSED